MTHRLVDNDGVALYVETRGVGPKVLAFVHGWISSRRMWYDVVERLDPERFTMHLLDFRGAGLSDRPSSGHDVEGYASDLRALLRELGGAVTVVAHSMGGKVTQFVATDAPPELQRMILVAPGSAKAYRMSERHRERAEAAFGSRVRIREFQRAAMLREVGEEALERLVEDALLAQRESWFDWYDRGRAADFSPLLGQISIPSLVAGGERDPLVAPLRLRKDVVEPIRGAMYVELRGVGHNLPIEAPAEVAGIVERFA